MLTVSYSVDRIALCWLYQGLLDKVGCIILCRSDCIVLVGLHIVDRIVLCLGYVEM